MKRIGLKTIIGFFGIMFLVFGGIAWGQENLCKTNGKRIGTPEGNLTIGICNCNDGYKRVDKEGCKPCSDPGICCGIQLNTNVPFIGNCIELSKGDVACTVETEATTCPGGKCEDGTCVFPNDSNQTTVTDKTAFPRLMGGLTKILVTIIILAGFIGILAGGVMISASGGDDTRAAEGRKLIIRVVMALALLGASGVILRLINPNFFG